MLELAGRRRARPRTALACVGLRPALLRAQREGVLVLAAHAPALGDVLARLAHRLAGVPLLVAGVREPPAEGRVVDRPVPARVRGVRLRRDERRARHRLDAARDEEVAVPGDHRVAGADDRGEARRAEAVHRHARDGLRQAREQRREPRDVPVVLARLVRAAEPDVLDLGRRHAGALDRRGDRDRGEVVGTDARRARRRIARRASGRPTGRPRASRRLRPRRARAARSRTRCSPRERRSRRRTGAGPRRSPPGSARSAAPHGRAARARARVPSRRAPST